MGEIESSDDDTKSASMSGSATQSAHSKGWKRKESHKEEPPNKKHKLGSRHPSTSTSFVHKVEMNQAASQENQPPKESIDPRVNESMESTVQNSRCEKIEKGKQPSSQDNSVPLEQINDKIGKDVYLDIENEDEEVTSPP